jgi:hypothetical protein
VQLVLQGYAHGRLQFPFLPGESSCIQRVHSNQPISRHVVLHLMDPSKFQPVPIYSQLAVQSCMHPSYIYPQQSVRTSLACSSSFSSSIRNLKPQSTHPLHVPPFLFSCHSFILFVFWFWRLAARQLVNVYKLMEL